MSQLILQFMLLKTTEWRKYGEIYKIFDNYDNFWRYSGVFGI